MLTKRFFLNVLLATTITSTEVSAFAPVNNSVRRGQLYMSQNNNRPSFLSKNSLKRSIFDKLKPKSTKLSASVSEGGLSNEGVEEKKIHPGILYSMVFAPAVAAWAFTSKNIYQEVILSVSLFLNLLSLKLVDGIVDDGLRFFKGAKYVMPVFTIALAVALFFANDFIATWYSGLTLAIFLAGKLDCIEFQSSALIVAGMCFLRFFSGKFTFGIVDVLAITVGTGLDEGIHEVHKKLTQGNKKLNQIFEFLLECRLLSVWLLVPYFILRGTPIAAPLLVAQGAGYEVGGFIVEKMLKNRAEKK